MFLSMHMLEREEKGKEKKRKLDTKVFRAAIQTITLRFPED